MGKIINLEYNGEPFEAYEAVPEGRIKGGLIVIEEVWGMTDHIKDVADRYAQEGYYVLSPELLSEIRIKEHAGTLMLDMFNPEKRNEAQPKVRELTAPIREPEYARMTLGRIHVCFDYLHDQPRTKQWVAITGFCFGGSYSYSFALEEPRLKVALPFYGHANIEDSETLKKISCPVRAFYGERDERLMSSLPEVEKAMQNAGVDFSAKVYSDCGHAFFNDTNPFAYNEAAATDAWGRALEILAANQ